MAAFCLQDMPGSPLRNPAPRVPAAAPVANAGGGRGRGTRNRDVAAFHNPMYNEVSINAVSTPGAAANAATTSQESDHGQIEPAPLASRKDSIDVGLDLSTFDDATPDGMAFGFGTGKAGTATAGLGHIKPGDRVSVNSDENNGDAGGSRPTSHLKHGARVSVHGSFSSYVPSSY